MYMCKASGLETGLIILMKCLTLTIVHIRILFTNLPLDLKVMFLEIFCNGKDKIHHARMTVRIYFTGVSKYSIIPFYMFTYMCHHDIDMSS